MKTKDKDIIRHGEAVGIGMLCEIYYCEGKSKKFKFLFNLLRKYKLPTNLKSFTKNYKKQIVKKKIFKNIFLDKKRIGKYPRIIKILKLGKPKVVEMKDNYRIKKTINEVIFKNEGRLKSIYKLLVAADKIIYKIFKRVFYIILKIFEKDFT